jgi:hypothetical protein
MALVSKGYDGSITETDLPRWVRSARADYGVLAAGDWKVTTVAGQDRTISIATGTGFGRAVVDTTDAAETIQLATVASGTRWDTIVARRNYSTNTTTFVAVQGTASRVIAAGRLTSDLGGTDDQPLALVQITSGQQLPTGIVDLRCWAGNGGLHAASIEALAYLDAPGSSVRVGADVWDRQVDTAGAASWVRSSTSSIDLYGRGGSISGGTPATDARFLMQAGSLVQSSNGSGFAPLTFPVAFPTGLVSIVLLNGDAAQGDLDVEVAGGSYGNGSRTGVTYKVTGSNGAAWGSKLHRVNWIAVGW